MAVGRQESRRRHLGAVQHVAVRTRQRDRGGASRSDAGTKSWFENEWETVAIREGVSDDFLFYFCVDGSIACWAVRASRPTNACPDETDTLPTALSIKLLTCEQKKLSFLACTHTIN
jgi:hypothetical protein